MTDVCLMVENSYPYRTGGVSEAVDDLIRSLPDVRFSVLHLHDPDERLGTPAYASPDNLTQVLTAPIGPSASGAVPDALVYHALCTGEASDVAGVAARERDSAFVLTEHGLAWHEARLGIVGCKPFRTRPRPGHDVLAALRRQVARAYEQADAITTVCADNACRQITWGADPRRVEIVPNAVAPRRTPSFSERPLTVGLVGRVVPVKDIVTFLHACRLVADQRDDVRFEIIGPLDHDPSYVDRCLSIVGELDLGRRLRFRGAEPRTLWPERLDVAVLTSVSEAQPLVLLEAMAAGRPAVSTAVGGCEQLLGGSRPAGLLTPPRDPRATATAILRLLSDPALRAKMGAEGRRRVRLRHDPEAVAGVHRRLYERLSDRQHVRA